MFRSRFLIFDPAGNNTQYYQQLIDAIKEEYRPIARVLLGQDTRYELLENNVLTQTVLGELNTLMKISMDRFEQGQKSILPKHTASQSHFSHFGSSFDINVKNELKRITNAVWNFSKDTNSAIFENDEAAISVIENYLKENGIAVTKDSSMDGKSKLSIDCYFGASETAHVFL